MENKILVFGGSGFLGSHVADALTAKGFQVTIFDINKSPFLQEDQTFIQGNILDVNQVTEACQGFDYIYNFAGLADINDAKSRPIDTTNLNILGHVHILEGARLAKAKRFIYASTVYVYSESGSFYRASKQAGERFTELYWDKYKLPYTILRYGSLYGNRADSRNAIYRFVKSALEQGEISYPGTGEELREYIHVSDAAHSSVEILASDYENQHLIITGHQQFRIKDVMLMIKEMLTTKNVKLKFNNEDVEAHYNITPYAYKPRHGKKLVCNPFVDFGQGILDCIHEIDVGIDHQSSD